MSRMSQHNSPGGFQPSQSSATRKTRSRRSRRKTRCSRLEWLEPRCVLAAPTLAPISNVTVLAGAPLNIPLNGADTAGDALTFTVTNDTVPGLVTTVSPSTDRSLKIHVHHDGDTTNPASDPSFDGDVVIQLFEDLAPKTTARIVELANSQFYNNLIFHRIIKDFMAQGGDPSGNGTGGSGTKFDDELNPNLQFTSSGLLAMANSGADTNDSQFFITEAPTRWLDFHHTIFGLVTQGTDIVQKMNTVPTHPSGDTSKPPKFSQDQPLHDVVMTSVSVISDTQDNVLRLSTASWATSGQGDVTVQVDDGHGGTTTQTFHVTIQPDTTNDPPFFPSTQPIRTTSDTPISLNPATDVEGDKIYYQTPTITPANPNVSVSVNNAGLVTITPSNGVTGVFSLSLKVAASQAQLSSTSNYDFSTHQFPLYITPKAPSIDSLLTASGAANVSGVTTQNNSSSSSKLSFSLTGLKANTDLYLYADGQIIAHVVPASDTMVVQTDGSTKLRDGTHKITAMQTVLNQTVSVGNLNTKIDLDSPTSAPMQIAVDTAPLTFTSAPLTTAHEDLPYVYDVKTNKQSGVTFQLTSRPGGMTIDSATGHITWTPTSRQVIDPNLPPVTVQATDLAGNSVQQTFNVKVLKALVLVPTPLQTVDVDKSLVFQVVPQVADTSYQYYFVGDVPQGMTIETQGGNGVVRWKPGDTYGGQTVSATVQVTNSAGELGQQTINVQVRGLVHMVYVPAQAVFVGQQVKIPLQITDSDISPSSVSYALAGNVSGAAIDSANNLVWNVPQDQAAGPTTLQVTATDSTGKRAQGTGSFTVNVVNDPNQVLHIASLPSQPATAGTSVSVPLSVTNASLPAGSVQFSLAGSALPGMSIDQARGLLKWDVPSGSQSGNLSVQVRAVDSTGSMAPGVQSFAFQVTTPTLVDAALTIPSPVAAPPVPSPTPVAAIDLTFHAQAFGPAPIPASLPIEIPAPVLIEYSVGSSVPVSGSSVESSPVDLKSRQKEWDEPAPRRLEQTDRVDLQPAEIQPNQRAGLLAPPAADAAVEDLVVEDAATAADDELAELLAEDAALPS